MLPELVEAEAETIWVRDRRNTACQRRANTAEALLRTEFSELNAAISPDANWLAYESNASGQYEIYVRPFPDVDSGRWQVSTEGGEKPLWAPDGGELFYVAPGGEVMAVPVQTEPTFTLGNGEVVVEGQYFFGPTGLGPAGRAYDIAPDGQHFLMIKEGSGSGETAAPTSIVVVEHWFEELKARVPAN